MGKIFFKNLGRALLTTIVVAVVAFFFTVMVWVVGSELLQIKFSVLALMIVCGVLSVIASFLWFCLAAGCSWDWFYSGEDDSCDHPPHLIIGFLLMLLILFAFGGTSALMGWLGYDKLVAAVAKNEDYRLLACLFPSVTVSQVMYFIVMMFHYGSWQVCWHCGRMFCIDYNWTGNTSWDSTSYKTYTRRENVGSISAGDKKIADISANVEHGYTETTHYTSSSYDGHCCRCGHGKNQSKLRSETK